MLRSTGLCPPQHKCLQQGRKRREKKEVQAEKLVSIALISHGAKWFSVPGAAGSSLLPGVRPAAGSTAELLCSSPGALPVWFWSFYFFFPRKIQSETRWQQHVTNHCLSHMPPPVVGHNTALARGRGHNTRLGLGMRFWKLEQSKLCGGVGGMPLA